MRKDVRVDILNLIKEGLKAIREKNILALKRLSNNTIHNASIYQDNHSTVIAVVIYSIYKIFDRSGYRNFKTWNFFYKNVTSNLRKAYISLKKNDEKNYDRYIKDIFNVVDKLDKKFKSYVKDIITQARIHKASRLHEHGVSAGRTAELLGVSEWEIMDYIGKTGISEVKFNLSVDVRKRLKFARSLFK